MHRLRDDEWSLSDAGYETMNRMMHTFLNSRAEMNYGSGNEIQRDILAGLALGRLK